MGLTPEFLSQLKSKIQLSSYVGKRVKLKRQGRNMSGCCPFHSEKSPSFIVNDEKGNYHCFGCGAHGDIISYLQHTENLGFIEAVEKLASMAGMTLPAFSKQSPEKTKEIKDIYDLLEEATSFFQSQLRSNEGQKARNYLAHREVKSTIQEQFRLGFAPSQNALKAYFLQKGYTEKNMIDAGLLVQDDQQKQSYDRFRSRLMFPIWDRRGRVVAFGGRTLTEAQPKYLNSPETSVFHKSSVLYAYHLSRAFASESKQVIVCEGYMDVIALHQGGFKNAVAPLGTALTEDQINLLWTLNETPTLCFDGDAPGQKAAYRAIERALPLLKAGCSLKFARLPVGEDPDSLLKNGSRDQLSQILETAVPLVDALWNHQLKNQRLQTPEDRAKFEKTLMSLVSEIKDASVRAFYKDNFWGRIRHLFKFRRKNQSGLASPLNIVSLAQVKPNMNILQLQQKILFAGILNYPVLLEEHCESFQTFELINSKFEKLRDAIVAKMTEDPIIDAGKLQKYLYNDGFSDLLKDILCDDVYRHAAFIKPFCEMTTVRRGWLEIWFHLQNTKKVVKQVEFINKNFQSSTSALLQAKMRGDFT